MGGGEMGTNHFFEIKVKSTFIPKSVTNFDPIAICPYKYYKFGALCYRDCSTLGMENCGIGACAISSDECKAGIVQIVTDFGMSFATFLANSVSMGRGSVTFKTAKEAMSKTIKTMKNTMTKGIGVFKKISKNPTYIKNFIKK